MTTAIMIAAEEALECSDDEITKLDYDFYGMDVYSAYGEEFAIGLPEEADEAVRNYIRDSLWTFRASYILKHSRVGETKKVEKAIEEMQVKLGEECNEIIYALLEDFEKFVKAAIEDDGRGVYLASYDGEELEINISGIQFLAYRLN